MSNKGFTKDHTRKQHDTVQSTSTKFRGIRQCFCNSWDFI